MIQKKSMNNINEIWKEIPELDGKYSISSLGRVRRNQFEIVDSNNKKFVKKSKLMAINDNGNGYKQLMIQVKYKRQVFYIHRLVAQLFLNNPENKEQVNHIDSDRSNNRVDNLEWVSIQENMTHAVLNRSKSKSKSGYIGIKRADTISEKWCARITYLKKEIYIGIFNTIEDAVKARNEYIVSNGIKSKIQTTS